MTWINVCAGAEMSTYLAQLGSPESIGNSLRLSLHPMRQGYGPGRAYIICKFDVLLDHDALDRLDLYDTAG